MKKFFLVCVLFLMTAFSGFAQEVEPEWRELFPRHEFSLGVGDPTMAAFQRHSVWDKLIWDRWIPDETLNDWFEPTTYHTDYVATCPISLGYMFRLRKFLWLGGSVSYMGIFGKVYDARNGDYLYNHTETQVAFLPAVRFSYLNKKYVTLYSGVSTGFLLNFEKDAGNTEVFFHPAFQVTAFGVSAGYRFFGYTEIGVGYKGYIQAGIGYRFNVKKDE